MIVTCREVSKNSGEIAVYPIKAPATERLLFQLQIRSRVNPELRYFVVDLARWENKEMWSAVKDRNEDAFAALSQEFERSSRILAEEWAQTSALAKIAVISESND